MKLYLDDFYRNKKVFVTGCTGFKGSWLCAMLVELGAKVTGYALEPDTSDNSLACYPYQKVLTIYVEI